MFKYVLQKGNATVHNHAENDQLQQKQQHPTTTTTTTQPQQGSCHQILLVSMIQKTERHPSPIHSLIHSYHPRLNITLIPVVDESTSKPQSCAVWEKT